VKRVLDGRNKAQDLQPDLRAGRGVLLLACMRARTRPNSMTGQRERGNRRLPAEAYGCTLTTVGTYFCQMPAYSGEETMRAISRAAALTTMLGFLASGSGPLAQDGAEIDLTGTWEGTQICDELIGGEFVNTVIADNPLLIVQDGDTLRFLYIGEPEEEIADDLLYEGVLQSVDGSDHFEALVGVCGGDYKAEEIVRLRRIESSETAARFDADFIFFTGGFPAAEGVLDFATCRWAYERVSTEPPDVPECQRPGIPPTRR
jgi:hypothetical protein